MGGSFRYLFLFLITLAVFHASAADKKISELNSLLSVNYQTNDLLVIVDTNAGETKNTTLGQLDNRYFLKLSDILGIAYGGTGLTSAPAAGSFIYSNGSAYTPVGSACTAGQLLKSNGSSVWSCSNDNNSGGTITEVVVGTGMTGGGTSGSISVGVNTELQGLSGLSTTGPVNRTGAGTYSTGSISLTTDVTGILPVANGGTNSSTSLNNFRVMISDSGSIIEAPAITASRALISDSNGIPTHSTVTSTTLGFLDATSSVQTQINGKEPTQTKGSISTSTTGVSVGSGSNSTVGPNVTINIQTASGSQPGLLSSTDWTTFNNKQAAGNYITALTSDVSASGPGSASATVNSVGGSTASSINSATVLSNNATSANTINQIVKRDGSGNFSAGTITASLTGNATNVTGVVAIANGGSGQTTANAALNAFLPTQTGNSGKFLTTNGTDTSWAVGGSSSPLTTKGDLYTYDTGNARLPVGTNGQVLSADSTESTGLKWITNTGSGATQALDNLTTTAINAALYFDPAFAGIIGSPNALTGVASSSMTVKTGTSDTGIGTLNFVSGDATVADVNGGNISFVAGAASGVAGGGGISIYSGNSENADAGAIGISGGTATGTGTGAGVTIQAGPNTGTGNGGSVGFSSGSSTGAGTNAGGINFNLGTPGSGGLYGLISFNGKADQNTISINDGGFAFQGQIYQNNGQNNLLTINRPNEKTLLDTTVSATDISGMEWADTSFGAVVVNYTMFEKSTGKVSRRRLSIVQNPSNAADIAFSDVTLVENTGFPTVVITAVSTGGLVKLQYTNASLNDVLFQAQVEGDPINFGSL